MHRRVTSTRSAPAAFTLLEMIVTLTVLLGLLSLVIPSARRLIANHELKDVSEQVRARVAHARINAIDHGITYQFRYEPYGQRFVVLPADQGLAEVEGPSPTTVAMTSQQFLKLAGKLPEDMRFQAVSGQTVAAETLTAEVFEGLPDAYELSQLAWSPPLLFYADGTADDGAFEIVDEDRETHTELRVRGLTGVVSVSDIIGGTGDEL